METKFKKLPTNPIMQDNIISTHKKYEDCKLEV